MIHQRIRLTALVLDRRSVRSANLLWRVAAFLKANARDPADYESGLDLSIVSCSKATDLDVGRALCEADAALILLHYADCPAAFRAQVLGALQKAPPGFRCRAVVYGLNPPDPSEVGRLRSKLSAIGHTLEVCVGVSADDGAGGVRAGLDEGKPPVERVLSELLGIADPRPYSSYGRASMEVDPKLVSLRHDMENACGPLYWAVKCAEASLASRGHLREVWRETRKYVDRVSPQLPAYVIEIIRRLDDALSVQLSDSSDHDLCGVVEMAAQLKAFAESLQPAQAALEGLPALADELRAMGPVRLLWIDDDTHWFSALDPLLSRCGIAVHFMPHVADWREVSEVAAQHDAVLLDIMLRGQGQRIHDALAEQDLFPEEHIDDNNAGIGVLCLIGASCRALPAFMLSAYPTADLVRTCTQYGAVRYFVKGQFNPLDLARDVRLEVMRRRREDERLLQTRNTRLIILGREDPASEALAALSRYAERRLPVLLLGESGSGKEEFAIEYAQKAGCGSRYRVVRCHELNPTLHGSELFGSVRGAYSGATDRAGLLEEADNGVVFIDEIDKLEKHLQAALLTFLSVHEVRRVGGTTAKRLNVAIVMATNRDLQCLLDEGALLPDWRRRVGRPVAVPSLQQRTDVVGGIASVLVDRIWRRQEKPNPALDTDATTWLETRAREGAFRGWNFGALVSMLEEVEIWSDSVTTVTAKMLSTAWGRLGARLSEVGAGAVADGSAERAAALALYVCIQRQPGRGIGAIRGKVEGCLWEKLLEDHTQRSIAALLGMSYAAVRQKLRELRRKNLLVPSGGRARDA